MSHYLYSISELTSLIKEELEQRFDDVHLRGEVSNFKQHSSGHLYFTLKDGQSQMNAIIWRTAAAGLAVLPEDGMAVVVRGRVEVYAAMGKYQVICSDLQPVGEGLLQKAFEKLFRELEAEGLFLESHKKALPRLPETIGIITSPTGAVIEDIRSVFARRYPSARLILCPVRVQGETAKDEIVAALNYLNRLAPSSEIKSPTKPATKYTRPDVIILGRGGGSIEDLWAFNEARVARAIYNSEIPVISAVGHQTDFTISDAVADLRAGTPSMAAELCSPSQPEILASLAATVQLLATSLSVQIQSKQNAIDGLLQSYGFNKPLRNVETLMQRLDFA
ncbi:MAG: exodeoxyribonuclease VII large subunit, partial [Rhizobacter sp.]|nr:exodeoxyribonuclease VII large subunit [Chlorobiales bacterium]